MTSSYHWITLTCTEEPPSAFLARPPSRLRAAHRRDWLVGGVHTHGTFNTFMLFRVKAVNLEIDEGAAPIDEPQLSLRPTFGRAVRIMKSEYATAAHGISVLEENIDFCIMMADCSHHDARENYFNLCVSKGLVHAAVTIMLRIPADLDLQERACEFIGLVCSGENEYAEGRRELAMDHGALEAMASAFSRVMNERQRRIDETGAPANGHDSPLEITLKKMTAALAEFCAGCGVTAESREMRARRAGAVLLCCLRSAPFNAELMRRLETQRNEVRASGGGPPPYVIDRSNWQGRPRDGMLDEIEEDLRKAQRMVHIEHNIEQARRNAAMLAAEEEQRKELQRLEAEADANARALIEEEENLHAKSRGKSKRKKKGQRKGLSVVHQSEGLLAAATTDSPEVTDLAEALHASISVDSSGVMVASAKEVSTVAPAEEASAVEMQMCVVCMEKEKTHLFAPCGHHCVCEGCSFLVQSRMSICPLCKQPIENAIRVYS